MDGRHDNDTDIISNTLWKASSAIIMEAIRDRLPEHAIVDHGHYIQGCVGDHARSENYFIDYMQPKGCNDPDDTIYLSIGSRNAQNKFYLSDPDFHVALAKKLYILAINRPRRQSRITSYLINRVEYLSEREDIIANPCDIQLKTLHKYIHININYDRDEVQVFIVNRRDNARIYSHIETYKLSDPELKQKIVRLIREHDPK